MANPADHHWIGRPTAEQMRAYLEGEHGPPSAEALQIIQDELEYEIRRQTPNAEEEA